MADCSPPAENEARLLAVRQRLADARGENLRAVTEAGQRPGSSSAATAADRDGDDGSREGDMAEGDTSRARARKNIRKRRRGDREPGDVVSKTLGRRVSRARRAAAAEGGVDLGEDVEESAAGELVVYGGRGALKPGAAERVAQELLDVARRQGRSKKAAPFDEDQADIGFINEHNRRFNAVVDRMYGKHEAVKEIKDNLERGTALP
jgi:SYF2 splicing factor